MAQKKLRTVLIETYWHLEIDVSWHHLKYWHFEVYFENESQLLL